MRPGVLCLGGRLVGGSIPTHAVDVFYVLEGLRPFGLAGARVVPQWTFPGLTWLVSEVVVACRCGAVRVGWWFQVVSRGLVCFWLPEERSAAVGIRFP